MSGDWAFSGLIDYVKVCKLLGYEIVCKAIVSSSQKLVPLHSSVGHVVFLRLFISNQTFSTASSDDIIKNSSIIRESIGMVGQVYPDG